MPWGSFQNECCSDFKRQMQRLLCRLMNSLSVHVINQDFRQRAQMSRAVIAAGHHAEIYSSIAEFELSHKNSGVIMAIEDDFGEESLSFDASIRQLGKWFGVIVTSKSPSIEKAVVAIRDGAMDYLPWPVKSGRLAWAIQQAAIVTLRNQHRYTSKSSARERIAALTPRERQVLALVADGLTNRMAGNRLGISDRTAEIHRNNAIKKLGVNSTAEAVITYFVSQEPD